MRVSFICFFCLFSGAQLLLAKDLSGQRLEDTYITLQLKNSSMDEAFRKIEKNTPYLFAYQPGLVGAYQVTLPKATRTVSATLELILKGTPLAFRQVGNNIIIFRQAAGRLALSAPDDGGWTPPADTTVTGVVLSAETHQPVTGASVTVPGTRIGTTTNNSGRFTLVLHSLAGNLTISSVGYQDLQVSLAGRNSFTIELKVASRDMDDVVVVGYGTKTRRDLTGTINSMAGDQVTATKAPNAQEAMQGQLPGVDVKRTSGKMATDMSIEIRGANSITSSTQPLYVIDGIPAGGINDINPADIERIDVLKDASSTAIYGSRGANGVVIITTRRGASGQSRIAYDAYAGEIQAYHLPNMMTGPQFVSYAREFYATLNKAVVPDANIFSVTELANIASGHYTNWVDLIKRNGLQTNHNISITGGDAKTQYFLSAGYQLYNGTQQLENQQKYTLKIGIDKTFTPWLRVGASMYNNYTDFNPSSSEAFRSAYRLRPTGSAYNSDGSLRFFAYESEAQITNPLFDYKNELRKAQYIRAIPNVYVEVSPVRGVKLRSSLTADIKFQRAGVYDDTYTKQNAGVKPNSASNSDNHWFTYNLDNFLTYSKTLGDHQLDVTAGNSLYYTQYDYDSTYVSGLPYRSLWFNVGSVSAQTINGTTYQPVISVYSAYSKQTIASFFGRIEYGYKHKYLARVSARGDGNSLFAQGHQWGFFPTAAVAWVASEEGFVKNIPAINFLKFRFSYGHSGNAAVSGTLYPYITQSTVATTLYDFNGSNANGSVPAILANKNISWEKTREYNLGFDLNLFANRIGMTVDLYNKRSIGSILSEAIPTANGFSSITTNLGSVGNKGIEVSLNTDNIRTRKFVWHTSLNFAVNKNQILDLYGNGKNDVGNARFLGQKVRVIYNYKITGVWQTADSAAAAVYGQKPGQWKVQDLNHDNVINSNDRQILGSDIPDWFGGITNTFRYANFDLGFTIYTRQGTFQQSSFYNTFVDNDQGRARFDALYRHYWTPTNPTNKWANLALEQDGTRRGASEYMNSSYTKVSNITLGYTFPKQMLSRAKLNSLRVYLTAYDPFIRTKFVGWDPETADLNTFGLQDFRTRTFLMGVSIGL